MKRAGQKNSAPKSCAWGLCQQSRVTGNYCRRHYLMSAVAKKQKAQRATLDLEKYVHKMASDHPDDFPERIKEELSVDASLVDAMEALGLDESDDNALETLLKKVR